MSERILRLKEVLLKVGKSKPTLLRDESLGRFPLRRQLGGRAVGWLESEVDAWINSLPKGKNPDGFAGVEYNRNKRKRAKG